MTALLEVPVAWPGWSSRPEECAPKIAALASLVNLAAPDPVASVAYHSRGNLLVIGGDQPQRAALAAQALAGALTVTLLNAPSADPRIAAWRAEVHALEGFLGEFQVTLGDLAVNGAAPQPSTTPARFDLVLDFSTAALFGMRQPPQGYFRAPADDADLAPLLDEIRGAVGEFEKPRYFAYRESICAHSRSQVTGCNACIDICSTQAISSDGDKVRVDPHLCMGCGACASACPSGAMGYQFPRPADRGAQVKQLLAAYRHAGGANPLIVFHDGQAGREALAAAAEAGNGLPPNALPLEAWHVAAIGLDVLLPAIAFGAHGVVVLASSDDDAEYVDAMRGQMAIGQAVLTGLGYAGTHFHLVQAGRDMATAFEGLEAGTPPAVNATFLVSNDKRTAIEFAVEHLAKHAPSPVDEIALPQGAPWGQVVVDRKACTLCLACVGACPASALMDGVDEPLLKFVERNCVQCGLCENTCPEEAIALQPRLLLTPAVREARVLNETQPFHCTRCQKPFGTRLMVEAMMSRLSGHSMFAGGDALKRLQMCADCRVVDMMAAKGEVSVLRLGDDA